MVGRLKRYARDAAAHVALPGAAEAAG